MKPRIATITFSDTRTEADDEGGALLRQLLEEAGFDVRSMWWFPRPTPLRPGQTPADWTKVFRSDVWREVPIEQHAELARSIDEACAGLRSADGWNIDYWRLRWVCRAT